MNTPQTFFFYDLETTGFSPRDARIMQFAGQRVSLDLEPIGEPHNHLIKLTDDILPSVDAILLTGITPQNTVADGVSEAEFLKIFHSDIATAGTIFVGFNNIRFDDEFIRFTNYRNFYDPYEWHWSNGRSRFDMLDVVRMTRALRPDGIKWPFASDGAPANRLEELAKINDLLHDKAHDALSDVYATIELAKLIRAKQPKLFEHLLAMRDKKLAADLVNSGRPFTYTSGKYASSHMHTTAATLLGSHPKNQGVFVFDLRFDPTETAKLSVPEVIERWQHYCKDRPCPHPRLPVKAMQFNRCPAIAPLGVIDQESAKRINIDLKIVEQNHQKLKLVGSELYKKILAAAEEMEKSQSALFANEQLAEAALYDSFIPDVDKRTSAQLVNARPTELVSYLTSFTDKRLQSLLPLYISRNYPKQQTDDIRQHWEKYRQHKLMEGGPKSRSAQYFQSLATKAAEPSLTPEQGYLLEELQLWGQSIIPVED